LQQDCCIGHTSRSKHNLSHYIPKSCSQLEYYSAVVEVMSLRPSLANGLRTETCHRLCAPAERCLKQHGVCRSSARLVNRGWGRLGLLQVPEVMVNFSACKTANYTFASPFYTAQRRDGQWSSWRSNCDPRVWTLCTCTEKEEHDIQRLFSCSGRSQH
jgi:hypothetical protein